MRGATQVGLLERDTELAAITALVDQTCAGSGGTLVIEGPSGVGKTALLERACQQAGSRGMTVLQARGGELEREFAWGVARQLFESSLASASAGAGAVRRPAMLEGSSALAEPVFDRGGTVRGGAAESFSTLHGLYWITVNVARDAPVLLAIDDLHWADRPSLRFAAHLAPRLEGLPIMLLAAIRPLGSEPASDTELLCRLTADPDVELLRPLALSQAASFDLVRTRLSDTAQDEFCQACHEMSRGNPFLLEELIDALRTEGAQATVEDADRVRRMTPDAVARNVLVRLATLPNGCHALARAIAVLGARAEFRQARRLANLDTDVAVQAAAALSRAGIVRGDSTLEFVHPLVRSAVYGDLIPTERARWHALAAELQASDGSPAQEVAPHLLESLADGNQRTVELLRQAAGQARAQGAPELSVDYLRRALTEPPLPPIRADVLHELGAAESVARPEDGIAHLREALEVAAPERRPAIALTLGDALAASGRLPAAISVFERGLRHVSDGDGQTRAHLEAGLIAAARWESSAQSLRRETVRRLHARAAAGEWLDPLLRAQLALEIAASGTQREVAVRHARGVLAAAPELSLGASTVPEVALVLMFAGFAQEAWEALQEGLAHARSLGWPVGIATSSTCASLTALHLGWIGEAIASAHGAMTPGAEIQFGPITLAFLVEALIERGDTRGADKELAERGFDAELALIWPTTPLLLARGRLRAATGDHAAAISDLLAVGERVAAWGLANPAMTPWRSSAAVSMAAVGERAEAIRLASEELERATRWGADRAIGVALRALGVAHGDEQGVDLLGRAAALLEQANAPVEHARSLYELGAALRRKGARAQAREQLRHALDLAHRHGAIAIAEQARDELLIAGARPRRDALRGRDALTSSELRVARLAAEGRTNGEIAQLLFVTPRTVETHLTSSYLKLGIRSRRELPAALHDQEPQPTAQVARSTSFGDRWATDDQQPEPGDPTC